jgi:hypothetical protein
MTRTLQGFAAHQLDEIASEYGPLDDWNQAVERRMRHLVAVCQVPDDILETMPEVSRHNEPQISPQEYDCGCVAITRITDRDYRHDEKPFEIHLAIPCKGACCELARLRTGVAPMEGSDR